MRFVTNEHIQVNTFIHLGKERHYEKGLLECNVSVFKGIESKGFFFSVCRVLTTEKGMEIEDVKKQIGEE